VQVENTIKTAKAFSEGERGMKWDFAENEIYFLQNSFFQEPDFIVSHFSDITELSQFWICSCGFHFLCQGMVNSRTLWLTNTTYTLSFSTTLYFFLNYSTICVKEIKFITVVESNWLYLTEQLYIFHVFTKFYDHRLIRNFFI